MTTTECIFLAAGFIFCVLMLADEDAWPFRVVGLVQVARRRSNLRTNNGDSDGLKAANFNIAQLRCKNVQNHFS